MKIGWGWRIVILYIGFVGGMSYLAYRCTAERIDLVTDNYYEKDLQYDVRYEKEVNAKSPEKNLKVTQDGNLLEISFPSGSPTGTLHFYKPNDASLDFNVDIDSDHGSQVINTSQFARGWWTLKADWTADDTGYYTEHRFRLQ